MYVSHKVWSMCCKWWGRDMFVQEIELHSLVHRCQCHVFTRRYFLSVTVRCFVRCFPRNRRLLPGIFM